MTRMKGPPYNPGVAAAVAADFAMHTVDDVNHDLQPPLTEKMCRHLTEHLSKGLIHESIIKDLMNSIVDEVERARVRHVIEYQRKAQPDEDANTALRSPLPDWHN